MDQLSPEDKAIGIENFNEAVGFTRRDFLKGVIAAGAVSGAGLGAMYFQYGKVTDPVRVGVIGTGDEGNVLIGGCTPDYVRVVAIADIRPSSIHRAFYGDWASPAAMEARPGLIKKQGYKDFAEASKTVKVYDGSNGGIKALLDDKDIEAVIIALPLHLHAPIAIQAMMRGKHVLTEKLMAHNIAQCKVMARVAKDKDLLLATGHQRHYSVLYDNAVKLIQWGMLGQLTHIRAQWHRGNVPGNDSWQPPLPGGMKLMVDGKEKVVDQIAAKLKSYEKALATEKNRDKIQLLEAQILQWEALIKDKDIDATKFGYQDFELKGGRKVSALEELIRWRLWARTGGGLMAELGSHQLDAASIFCSSLRKDGKKSRPISVHACGGRHVFPMDREAEDHVFCMYEFPGPEYDSKFVGYYSEAENYPPKGGIVDPYTVDPNKKITVTYSSINGNGFGGYGEVVMGTKGTMILEKEQEIMLYKSSDTSTKIGVKKEGEGYSLDTQASGASAASAVAKAASDGPVSRGYTEEIEHWAWCIRNRSEENKPRCYPEVAMADAVIALTTNVAINKSIAGEGGYIRFKDEWFERDSNETPDGSDVEKEMSALEKFEIL
ncbi:MAG: Gfo/Idh/MocA family oxidoreductase [Planctomycetaceae bacterium]|nr:Gfo/Idh/MocA family oxidoreductase [Planctomycetaceae bacterium]MBN8600074.1 Gfo/Idh/MocA family oxidoreductase [Planctomycetota bacterium]